MEERRGCDRRRSFERREHRMFGGWHAALQEEARDKIQTLDFISGLSDFSTHSFISFVRSTESRRLLYKLPPGIVLSVFFLCRLKFFYRSHCLTVPRLEPNFFINIRQHVRLLDAFSRRRRMLLAPYKWLVTHHRVHFSIELKIQCKV